MRTLSFIFAPIRIVGAICVIVIVRGVLEFLARNGIRADFWLADLIVVATSSENLGWITWIIAGCIGLVVIALWETGRAYLWPPHARAMATQSLKSPLGIPDWTIRELFFYIRPDCIDGKRNTANRGIWEDVGVDILDKASTGQLKVWGRKMTPGERRPLTLIDEDYWGLASFTYQFFAESQQFNPHTHDPATARNLIYTDLRVNRSQAMMLWPQDQSRRKEH